MYTATATAIGGRQGHVRNSMDLLCSAAEWGLGVVFGPSFVLGPLVQAGGLRPILSDDPSRPLDLSAVLPSNRHLSTKVRVFIDFLVQRFGARPRCIE